ncbi:MAG: Ig-like domain-containing protein, partial [Planctomycetota bacterium]|nr:Ig-like domain-containing protein [Planctomycetota bacterium]
GNLATTEDNQSTTQIFEVVVAAVNDVPTLDSVDDLALLEDDGVQTVDLTGITAGGGETQILQITASSNNPTLVADPIVDYTSANATGSLSLVPLSDQSGTTTITVTVTDAGFDGNLATTEDNQSTTQIFEVVVAAVNDVPTLDSLPDIQIPENASQTDIQLEGISAGGGESQVLAISSTSSNPSLIPNPVVNYTSPNSAGSIQFQPVSNTAGQSIITISVTDAGFDGNLATTEDNQTTNIVFTVTVQESNGSPTIDPIGNTTLPEDSPVQTLSLTGITAGAGESQPLQVTAVSGNDSLIPTPLILYTSAQTTGTLQFTPTANQHGATSITVIVTDGGLDGNLATPQDNASVTTSFDVEVTPLNDSPTINSLDDISLNEDDPTHQVSLTGISAGGDETQTLQISATSSNPALIADPIVTYTSANTTGLLAFTPVAEESGSTTITVTVTDAGFDGNLATAEDNLSTTQTFNVTVAELNDAPTLNPLNDLNLSEDSDLQTVALGGITAGGNEDQPLLVTATSNNHALISDPAVSYTSANTSGSLSFTPTATKSGTTTITVTVTDGGMDGNLSTESDNASSEQSFEVVVTATNDSPTINPISDLTVDENSGSTTLDLTGITAGDGETQPIRVTASSNHPLLIPNPSIDYTSPDSTGTLTFAPGTNKSGFATVTVVVTDGGLDEDLETPADNGTTEESFEIVVTPAFPWHNYDNPLDVNGDHATSPIDVLLIIQELNRNGSYELPTPRSELIPPFYDVNRDGWITPSDALQIINFLNFNNHQVSFGIEFSDTAGSLISTIESGSLFNVSYYAQDLSANPHGVYAAYIDMYYDASLMQIVSGPSFSPPYVNGSSGDTAISGIVDEWGAFAGFDETGGSRLLVSTLQFRAIDAGTALFGSGRADITPLHDVLLFGSNDAVMPELIEFDSKTLFITVPTGEGEEAGEGEAYFPGNSSTGTNMVFPSVDHSQATITSLPDYHFYSLGLGELYSMTHPVESNRPEYSDKITLSDLEEILDLWIGPTDR